MAYSNLNYRPNKRGRAILARAWEHVRMVPYKVTLRWLFYRLYQEGFYPDKARGYVSFIKLMSRARHTFYERWEPDTLADDTTAVISRGGGYDSAEDWARALAQRGGCSLHRWGGQEQYLEIWFEARAMIRQFEYLTHDVKLCPLGGQPSIPFKWELAKGLEAADRRYDLPIVVLYFGDLDEGGEQIRETVEDDVRKWANVDFTFVRAALNPGDELRYNLPSNPEKPGQYQWEAVDHEAASTIITGAVGAYVDDERMAEIARLEGEGTQRFRALMREFAS